MCQRQLGILVNQFASRHQVRADDLREFGRQAAQLSADRERQDAEVDVARRRRLAVLGLKAGVQGCALLATFEAVTAGALVATFVATTLTAIGIVIPVPLLGTVGAIRTAEAATVLTALGTSVPRAIAATLAARRVAVIRPVTTPITRLVPAPATIVARLVTTLTTTARITIT